MRSGRFVSKSALGWPKGAQTARYSRGCCCSFFGKIGVIGGRFFVAKSPTVVGKGGRPHKHAEWPKGRLQV